MKTTGLIRRIDELGRVVIPKEIRRSLRLKDGEEVEISLGAEELILKKYSRLSALQQICDNCADSLYKVLGAEVIVTDTYKVISICVERQSAGKNLSHKFTEFLQRREKGYKVGADCISVFIGQDKTEQQLILPIVVNGDLYGSLVIMTKEISEIHLKSAQTALLILTGQLEG